MWKHKESKWLVKGGRKVRCYLCGKKILAKGDLFLFHGDTGYYSHQSCQAESTTISGNERRRAVKKIAVGAAVVGAIAAGAGKFLDVSSQSKNSPAAQTILTSQGLIPPALTSDPANPVPGQMWYRSDAGVMAHFDGVQNRVVYSSEINDGNVNVTSKGIVNGLSVLPNDGKGGFGPDTKLGATAPGQYGSPYTETTGGMESVNYALSISITNPPDIYFSPGTFYLSAPIVYKQTTTGKRWHFPNLHGAGSNGFGTSPYTTGTTFMPTSSFPAGEYHLAILQDDTGANTVSTGTIIEGINLYGKDSSGTLLAAGFISDCLGFSNVYMSIEYTIAPNPTLTKSVLESSYGAFNFGTTTGAGTPFNLINVQVRDGGLDGIYNRASQSIYSGAYSGGNARYGILDYDTGSMNSYGERTVYINSPANGFQEATFTGTLPSFMPSSAPKTANFAIVGSALSVYDYEDFEGANENGPAVYIYQAEVDFFGGNMTGAFGPTSTLSWPVIDWDTNGGYVNFFGTTFYWNQDYQYLISGKYNGPNNYIMQFTGGSFAANGTLPSDISGVIDSSSLLQESGIIHFSNVLFNGTIYPSPITFTPTSGDTYQNTYGRTLWIYSQITLNPTSTAAATAYLRIGTSSTAGDNPIVDEISIPAGVTTGFIITLKAPLYAGQYYEIDVTNATIGTTTGITNSD